MLRYNSETGSMEELGRGTISSKESGGRLKPYFNPTDGLELQMGDRLVFDYPIERQDDNTVYIIDISTNSLQARITTGDVPIRVAFSPNGKYAFIPNRVGNCVSVIDTARKLEIQRIPTGIWPGGVTFNAAGDLAYIANNKTNDISVIDVATLKVIKTIDVGIHPDGIVFCRVTE